MTESTPLLAEVRDRVLTVTINRPEKRNALNLALLDSIGDCFREHAGNEDIACAVLTGAGDRAFAAGGDLKELDAVRSDEQTRAMSERGHHALDGIRDFPVPVVAVLNGHALGGGSELAIACDFRLAAAHADIGFIQAQLAVTTAWGGGIDLMHTVGPRRALRLLSTGQRLTAAAAEKLGVVDAVCPEGDSLEEFTAAWTADWCKRSRQVLTAFKAVDHAQRQKLHERLTGLARDQFIKAWTHDDHWQAAENALKR